MKRSSREVIWVQGAKCEEGNNFFQEYIDSKFSLDKVWMGYNYEKESIYHTIRNRPY